MWPPETPHQRRREADQSAGQGAGPGGDRQRAGSGGRAERTGRDRARAGQHGQTKKQFCLAEAQRGEYRPTARRRRGGLNKTPFLFAPGRARSRRAAESRQQRGGTAAGRTSACLDPPGEDATA